MFHRFPYCLSARICHAENRCRHILISSRHLLLVFLFFVYNRVLLRLSSNNPGLLRRRLGMAILSKILHLAFLVSLTQALPARRAEALEVATYNGETSGRYIVTLKEGIKKSTTFDSFKLHRRSGALNVTHEWDAAFFNGFAGRFLLFFHVISIFLHALPGEFDEAALEDLRANNDVAAIEEDGLMYANAYATQ